MRESEARDRQWTGRLTNPTLRLTAVLTVVAAALVALPQQALALPLLTEEAVVDASSRIAGSSFALSENWAFVADPDANLSAGEVRVYRRDSSGWVQMPTLVASDSASNARFGEGIAASGDWLAVVDQPCSACGSMYLFKRTGTTWEEVDKVSPSPHQGEEVGYSGPVSLAGSVIAASVGEFAAHPIYVHRLVNGQWTEDDVLEDPVPGNEGFGPGYGDRFTTDGSTIAVSDPHDAALYLFQAGNSGWELAQTLEGQNGQFFDLDGSVLAALEETQGGERWQIDVYEQRNAEFEFVQSLQVDHDGDGLPSIAVHGESILIGVGYDSTIRVRAGGATLFREVGGDWIQAARLASSTPRREGVFGAGVDLDGDIALVSASTGLHAFDLGGPTCGGRLASIVGTSDADVLVGTAGDDVIVGLGGNDKIYGNRGNDILCGDAGWDRIFPGRGVDYVNGGSGLRDWVDYSSARRRVVVSLRAGVATGQGRDTLVSVENIVGSQFNDKLIGNSRRNRIKAGAGADSVWGKGRGDLMWGQGGRDTLVGGSGADVARGGAGADTCTAEVELSC